jgi:hypothetical protein
MENQNLQIDLQNLLVDAGGIRTRRANVVRSQGVCLKPIQDLKLILRSDPFGFGFLRRQVSDLLGKWAFECIDSLRPFLEDEEHPRTPRKLTAMKFEKSTPELGPDDAKPEAVGQVIYSTHTCQHTVKEHIKSQSQSLENTQVLGESTGETEDAQSLTDDEDNLPEHPNRKASDKKRKARINFSDDEKYAIKSGVVKVGTGNWKRIKDLSPQLSNRTSKCIKVSRYVDWIVRFVICPF